MDEGPRRPAGGHVPVHTCNSARAAHSKRHTAPRTSASASSFAHDSRSAAWTRSQRRGQVGTALTGEQVPLFTGRAIAR